MRRADIRVGVTAHLPCSRRWGAKRTMQARPASGTSSRQRRGAAVPQPDFKSRVSQPTGRDEHTDISPRFLPVDLAQWLLPGASRVPGSGGRAAVIDAGRNPRFPRSARAATTCATRAQPEILGECDGARRRASARAGASSSGQNRFRSWRYGLPPRGTAPRLRRHESWARAPCHRQRTGFRTARGRVHVAGSRAGSPRARSGGRPRADRHSSADHTARASARP